MKRSHCDTHKHTHTHTHTHTRGNEEALNEQTKTSAERKTLHTSYFFIACAAEKYGKIWEIISSLLYSADNTAARKTGLKQSMLPTRSAHISLPEHEDTRSETVLKLNPTNTLKRSETVFKHNPMQHTNTHLQKRKMILHNAAAQHPLRKMKRSKGLTATHTHTHTRTHAGMKKL